MNATISFLIILFIYTEAFADSARVFRGVVMREDGKPVAGAPVILYQNFARKWTWFPKSDREIARAVTNRIGKFVISTSDDTSVRKLMLVARGERRIVKVSKGTEVVVYDHGLLFKVSDHKSNIIVVPLGYVPAKHKRSLRTH